MSEEKIGLAISVGAYLAAGAVTIVAAYLADKRSAKNDREAFRKMLQDEDERLSRLGIVYSVEEDGVRVKATRADNLTILDQDTQTWVKATIAPAT